MPIVPSWEQAQDAPLDRGSLPDSCGSWYITKLHGGYTSGNAEYHLPSMMDRPYHSVEKLMISFGIQ